MTLSSMDFDHRKFVLFNPPVYSLLKGVIATVTEKPLTDPSDNDSHSKDSVPNENT
jgi:hypothetical protein